MTMWQDGLGSPCAVAREGDVKTSTTIALAVASLLSGSLAASAQTEQPNYHLHHYVGPHHTVHHHFAHSSAPAPEPTAQRPGVAIESAPPQTNQMFRPYAQPEEGDDDGLSRDPDDCMKGCIGGNPQ
jgi:hypothetical protein